MILGNKGFWAIRDEDVSSKTCIKEKLRGVKRVDEYKVYMERISLMETRDHKA